MKRLSWKYMAGIIDGEGCIDLQHGKRNGQADKIYVRPRVRISFANPGLPLLEMISANFGGDHRLIKRSQDKPNWTDSYTWGIHGKKCRGFLQNIVNHLVIKKEQARFAIWIIDNVTGKHVSEAVRERLVDEMKAMKRDPHRLSEAAVADLLRDLPVWSKNWKACRGCGTTSARHEANGYCKPCYDNERYRATDAIVESA